jgi:hypothetical protein
MLFGSPRARGYLGNNRTRTREEDLEENNIPSVPSKFGDLYITSYRYPTYRHILI